MKDKLIGILEPYVGKNKVFLQGTIAANVVYPAKFITFFTNASSFEDFYDNNANRIDWTVSVIFYSSNPAEVYSVPPQIIRAMRAEGFLPQNAGVDVISDVQTHTGWAMDFIYPEKYQN